MPRRVPPQLPLVLLLLASGCAAVPLAGPATSTALWLGGDVHMGAGAGPLFSPPPPALAGTPGFVNLEGPVGAAPPAGARLLLHNEPSALPRLRAAGVRACGIANNHARDRGPGGPAETAARLRAAGLAPAGGPAGAAMLRLGGLQVAVTAHDLGAAADLGAIEADLRRARASADVLVATFHTTGPPSYLPGPALRGAVDRALAAGAAVVAAHGSHSIGKLERRGGAVIAWGLGNLRFGCDCTDESDGLILRLELGRQGVVSAAALPVEAGLRGQPARAAREPDGVFDLLESLGTELRRDGALGRLR